MILVYSEVETQAAHIQCTPDSPNKTTNDLRLFVQKIARPRLFRIFNNMLED